MNSLLILLKMTIIQIFRNLNKHKPLLMLSKFHKITLSQNKKLEINMEDNLGMRIIYKIYRFTIIFTKIKPSNMNKKLFYLV
jgi:hypothetical protein